MSPSAIMEQDKPFKTIEVIDSQTGKLCKIACMSCIRGHRTTSCGIPVCRSKIFWTVKRPGRPSNSCTCRYGPGKGCECVVAKSACPHKPKKGEKRTVDCRCDEQGRYCCLLEARHWDQLLLLQNPTVTFFSPREALEGTGNEPSNGDLPPTPAYSASTPQTLNSLPNTPGSQQNTMQSFSAVPQSTDPTQSAVAPRFGLMGVGTPWGSGGFQGQDVLVWEGQAPPAPRDYQPYTDFNSTTSNSFSSPLSFAAAPLTQYKSSYDYVPDQFSNKDFAPVTQSMQDMKFSPDQAELPSTHTLDFERMMSDYFDHQYPSALCQNCGLSGCSCRNCPAVMQTESGSWAQGCARKHVQFGPTPTVQPTSGGCCSRNVVAMPGQDVAITQPPGPSQAGFGMMDTNNSYVDPTLSPDFNFDDLKMVDVSQSMDLSEFLMSDINGLEEPAQGCCCSGR